ncbi:MAG: hypothetical protein IJU76_04420 [Desulfovibrionaceae bacterium]|nr:hypothetical protein [Desulfovibrionaceae bacterium]
MAFRIVDARARLWQARGLHYLLGEQKNALLTYGVRQARSFAPEARPVRPVRPAYQYQGQSSARPAQVRRPEAPVAKKPVEQKTDFEVVPFEKWPEAWQKIGLSAKPGNVAWSYPYLGYDLGGVETTDRTIRREFFIHIFSEKPPYPLETYTFWPYALPNEHGELVTNLPIFLAGLVRLKAQAVILLGEEAGLQVLSMGTPYSHRNLPHGIGAMVFQDIAKLRESDQLYKRMMGMVRTLMARFGIFPVRSS